MLLKTGRITAIDGQSAQLRFDRTTACGQCKSGQTCGLAFGSIAGKLPESTLIDITLPETAAARPGDLVTVSLSGRQLVRMAGLAYLVPLFGMIAGAWLGPVLYSSADPDLSAAAGMVLGLGSGFLLMFLSRRQCAGLSIRA